MLSIKDAYVTIWEVEDKGGYYKANLSSSKKNKDGTYTNMSWKGKFVGKAANIQITERDRIKITQGAIEVRKWEEKFYYDVIVFDFEFVEKKQVEETVSTPLTPEQFKQMELEGESELPF